MRLQRRRSSSQGIIKIKHKALWLNMWSAGTTTQGQENEVGPIMLVKLKVYQVWLHTLTGLVEVGKTDEAHLVNSGSV